MIVTRAIGLRIAAIILATVLLQSAFFSQISILGTSPDVLPVVAVALGLLGGGVVGAVCAFALGFGADAIQLHPLGVSSLALLPAGYLAGRFREGYPSASVLTAPALTGVLAFVAGLSFAGLQLMLGVDAPVSLLVVRELIVQSILAALLAFPIYPLVRRLLGVALIEDERPRRTGVSPLEAA